MPPRSRRTLLELVATGATSLVAGCWTDSTTETPSGSPTESATATSTAARSRAGSATSTQSPAETSSPSPTPGSLQCGPVARPESAWPLPRHTPAADGYVDVRSGFESRPAVVWSVEPERTESEYARPTFGQPLVVDGTVYAVNRQEFGPNQPDPGGHRLQAHDAADGTGLWTYELSSLPSVPWVSGETVFLLNDYTLHAVDRTDGTRRWTRTFDFGPTSFLPVGNRLYVTLAINDKSSGDAAIEVLDEHGTTTWSRRLSEPLHGGPVLAPNRVYLGFETGTVRALSPSNGRRIWQARLGRESAGSYSWVEDLVATACGVFAIVGESLFAFDHAGRKGWRHDRAYSRLGTDGGTVYGVVSGRDAEALRAIEAPSGDTRWRVGDEFSREEHPVVTDDAVCAATADGLRALETGAGEPRWTFGRQVRRLAVAGGTLYGVDDGGYGPGRLLALR